jgi:methylmalonyl-CoA mutase N-terminal domain/subunit
MSRKPERGKGRRGDPKFRTLSGLPVERLYSPQNTSAGEGRSLGEPGKYPFTRGIHPDMYRGRVWTMRQFAGFGTPEDTNRRFLYLLKKGQTGLSTAFDMPTLMGRDSDDPLSLGEVGREGVAIDTIEDMETLFRDIPLGAVSTSMTINGSAAMILAMYVVAAERQRVSTDKLRGTLQNDILKEYMAQKEWIYPPRPSLRIITDMLGYCTREMPLWNTISISGYHIREAGSTAVQELAYTLANGFAYVEAAVAAGLEVDEFAPRLSFFFNAHNDFFEEIAKYRAARRIWAKRMREKYGAKKERSWMLRFHTQTAGCSLTAQQPENNIVRVAYQALAAVLGGTQSLHTNSMDEALALPTEKAVRIALRSQQILASETGVVNTVDPLGGSYFLEDLTDRMEKEAEAIFAEIEERGGVVAGIEEGYFQREIAESAWRYQQDVENGTSIVVGVNDYIDESEGEKIPVLEIGPKVEREQIERLRRFRARRDGRAAEEALAKLRSGAESGENLMPLLLEAVRANTTLGEMCGVLRGVFGEYREPAVF